MSHALALAARGLGRVWPNPAVGCVIVRNGRLVGRGRTADGGRPHAEPQALAMAGAAARGATAYVTLEPCAHHGKTPPCSEALIAAGVARVVVALTDPDARVSGRGIAQLRDAGIEVTTGVMEPEARALQAGFLMREAEGRPWLTLKLALTLDGRIATATGESRWITGGEARRAVHGMRARHDAVLVGGGTARADDPMLNVRGLGVSRQPLRLVASRRLDLPWPNRLSASTGEGPVWILHGDRDTPAEAGALWEGAGARLLPVAVRSGRLDPLAMLRGLGAEGVTRVFCEGGGSLAASLLEAGLVDELLVFSAGKILGAEGRPGVGALGVDQLALAPRFDLAETRVFGADVMHRWLRPSN
ncbi:MAG: bifunctional diaminohydroxyphosphoribosylaminopyrimidine deaminase/5-amino-6-(5-phosphoribosylamino)uracil reductase RibD [Silicimonas sp.]|nr:bifunctional diaminohydroxyphosphoribosylaminopyrimidine deaminase/5-amino-6-(5-phosphoribosylamino)uracil reductase RibD [Silicimonas sp.]